MRTAKILSRLGGCPGWSESSLGAHSLCWFLSCRGSHASLTPLWCFIYYCNGVLFCFDRKRALEEEQRKNDIWTKETFNNTITNENYLDFNDTGLQIKDDENLGQTATSSTQSSAVSGGSGFSFLGQQGKRASKVLPSKLFIGRSKSSYSDDALEVQDPDSRGRASTFTHGKRRKVKHDTHNLVDHIETDDHQGILESVDNILKTQNKHIMTEL